MKLGIKITVFLIVMVGRIGVCETDPSTGHTPGITSSPNTGPVAAAQTSVPTQRPHREHVLSFIDEIARLDPFTKGHLESLRNIGDFVSKPFDPSSEKQLSELVRQTSGFFPSSSEFSQENNREGLIAALKSFAGSTDKADKAALESIVSRIKDKEQILKVSEQTDEKKEQDKVAQEKAAKEKAAQEAQLQALQQQALLAAAAQAQQGNQGSGGSGSGSGSGSNSKGSSSPQSSSSNNDSQPKHDNLADQLSRAFSQNNQNQNLSSMFNNNNSSSSSSSSEKKKDDGFKFDVTPKTSQNEVKPVSAKNNLVDANPAMDPSAQGAVNPSLQNVLSGPTSVPNLISQASTANPFAFGGDGGSQGTGFSGNIKGNASGADGGNAQEIFSGVGKVDYGELPPPIRKASPEFGGEGGGFGESSEGGGGSSSVSKKKESLINELVLMTNNPRAKGRGIMAFVGVQVKDVCTKPGLKKIGVCVISREKNKFERVSVIR